MKYNIRIWCIWSVCIYTVYDPYVYIPYMIRMYIYRIWSVLYEIVLAAVVEAVRCPKSTKHDMHGKAAKMRPGEWIEVAWQIKKRKIICMTLYIQSIIHIGQRDRDFNAHVLGTNLRHDFLGTAGCPFLPQHVKFMHVRVPKCYVWACLNFVTLASVKIHTVVYSAWRLSYRSHFVLYDCWIQECFRQGIVVTQKTNVTFLTLLLIGSFH